MSGPVAALERVTFRGLRGASLEVPEGLTIVHGPNGSGKTSMALLLLGLAEPVEGRVTVLGLPPAAARARGLVRGSLSPPRLDPSLRVEEFLGVHGGLCRGGADVGGGLLVEGLEGRLLGGLSSGEARRVDLARVFSCVPRGGLLVLDEPSENLDSAARRRLAGLVAASLREARGVVVVTHDEGFARLLAGEVGEYTAVELRGGVFSAPLRVKGLPSHSPSQPGAAGGVVLRVRGLARGSIPVSPLKSLRGVVNVDYSVDVAWVASRLGLDPAGALPLQGSRVEGGAPSRIVRLDEVMVEFRVEADSVDSALEALRLLRERGVEVERACLEKP